jgi:predicted nucleic acid-binding protein
VARRLILDTSVLIAYERAQLDRSQFDDDDLVIGAISVAEFRQGAEHAQANEREQERLAALAELKLFIDVLDYTETTAAHHAKLLALVRRAGRPRGGHDLLIAAHAAETGRTIVSMDVAARFGDLPGVRAVAPT